MTPCEDVRLICRWNFGGSKSAVYWNSSGYLIDIKYSTGQGIQVKYAYGIQFQNKFIVQVYLEHSRTENILINMNLRLHKHISHAVNKLKLPIVEDNLTLLGLNNNGRI